MIEPTRPTTPRRSRRLAFAGVFVVFLVWAPRAHAQTLDPSLRADIEELLTANGYMATVPQLMDQTVGAFLNVIKASQPDMSTRALSIAREVIVADFTSSFNAPDGLKSKLVALYASHLTHPEVTQLLAFYKSEVGRKLASITPVLSQEAFAAGQAWGESLAPKVGADLDARFREVGVVAGGSNGGVPTARPPAAAPPPR